MFFRLFANRRLFVLLIAVILLIVTVGMTRGERDSLTWPEAGVKNGFAWINGLFSAPTYAITNWFSEWGKVGELSDENRQLKKKANSYLQIKSKMATLKRENEQLKGQVNYVNGTRAKTITAKAVARTPDRWNDRIVIDRGTTDGVAKDMPVITHEGLIGRVKVATGHMADVQLLTDTGSGPGIAAHVKSGNEESFGLIEGYDPDKKRLLLKKVSPKAKLKKGQTVVTSGLSDIYSEDLLIGTVDKVTSGEFGVDQMAYVKPAAGIEHLNYVMVVKNPTKLQLKDHRQKVDSKEENEGE
ncbi:rod shape-determining protein MreC [Marininema mesophilum]|uniref:Cell shape-determining protein MreC n=1 Tax=Marininema mesophilum TaxID=1048340 RepID=A0A1H2S4L7_9BACL|nr:rod shape-determining protein MreC [Marininema mesophilum]SDW26114.1 rod shape-determining protein MreC [Marininema mesophilum]